MSNPSPLGNVSFGELPADPTSPASSGGTQGFAGPMIVTGRDRPGHMSAWQAIVDRTNTHARNTMFNAEYTGELIQPDGGINRAAYLAALPGDATAHVRAPVPDGVTMPAAYDELHRRSSALQDRLAAICADLEAAYREYTSGPARDVVAALARGEAYAPAFGATGFDEAVRALDNEACAIARALPEIVAQARDVAPQIAPAALNLAKRTYAAADEALAADERQADATVAAALEALRAAQAEREAVRTGASAQAFNAAAWFLAWAERLPAGVDREPTTDRYGELQTTARPSYVAPSAPERPAGWVNSISDAGGY